MYHILYQTKNTHANFFLKVWLTLQKNLNKIKIIWLIFNMSGITGLKQKLHTLPLNYSSDLESAKLNFCCFQPNLHNILFTVHLISYSKIPRKIRFLIIWPLSHDAILAF